MKHHCPMCAEQWNEDVCASCGWQLNGQHVAGRTTKVVGLDLDVRVSRRVKYDRAQDERDAHLIAAAPELYAALLEARNFIIQKYPRESMAAGNWPTVKPLVERLDAALAKAEGR